MRVISRFADTALDEPAPDQRVKLFKELARLRASEPRRVATAHTVGAGPGHFHTTAKRTAARD